MSSWWTFPVMVVDVESTGLPSQSRTRACEVGAVLATEDGVQARWSSLVNPWFPRRRHTPTDEEVEALSWSGLTVDELVRAPGPKDVSASLVSWWITQGRPMVTSWRVDFDRPVMARSMPVADIVTWGSCIHEVAHEALGRGPDRGPGPVGPHLSWACSQLGIDVPEHRHRALVDAELAAQALVALTGGRV